MSDGSGDGYARKSPQELREEEAERMYEEALGESPGEEPKGELPRDGERS
jgi:hypothetical protein